MIIISSIAFVQNMAQDNNSEVLDAGVAADMMPSSAAAMHATGSDAATGANSANISVADPSETEQQTLGLVQNALSQLQTDANGLKAFGAALVSAASNPEMAKSLPPAVINAIQQQMQLVCRDTDICTNEADLASPVH